MLNNDDRNATPSSALKDPNLQMRRSENLRWTLGELAHETAMTHLQEAIQRSKLETQRMSETVGRRQRPNTEGPTNDLRDLTSSDRPLSGGTTAPCDPMPSREDSGSRQEHAAPSSIFGPNASQVWHSLAHEASTEEPPRAPSVTASPSSRLRHVDQLLALPDVEFVSETYRHILGREPDPLGYAHFVQRVVSLHDKVAIVCEFATSAEAASRTWSLEGLDELIALRRPRKGRLRRWLQRVAVTMSSVSRLESAMSRVAMQLDRQFGHADAVLGNLTRALATQSSNLADVTAALDEQAKALRYQREDLAHLPARQLALHEALARNATESLAVQVRQLHDMTPWSLALAENTRLLSGQAVELRQQRDLLHALRADIAASDRGPMALQPRHGTPWSLLESREGSNSLAPGITPRVDPTATGPAPAPKSALSMRLSTARGPTALFEALAQGLAETEEARRLAVRPSA